MVANCDMLIAADTPNADQMYGPLEIINAAAARSFQERMSECENSTPLDHGEDHFLHECALDTFGLLPESIGGSWDVYADAARDRGILMDPKCRGTFEAGCVHSPARAARSATNSLCAVPRCHADATLMPWASTRTEASRSLHSAITSLRR